MSTIIQKAPIAVGGNVPVAQQQSQTATTVTQTPYTPKANNWEITRFQFRKLFTTTERITIDNAQYNPSFSGSVKAAIFTMQKDMEVSATVNLKLPDTIQGVNFLVTAGILTPERALRILNNLAPL